MRARVRRAAIGPHWIAICPCGDLMPFTTPGRAADWARAHITNYHRGGRP